MVNEWREEHGAAVITRYKVYRSRRITGPGFAWKYLYTVWVQGNPLPVIKGCDRLDIARREAKKVSN